MIRSAIRALFLLPLAMLTACGEAPLEPVASPPAGDTTPGAQLQQVSFAGVADPSTGRLQILTGPLAAIGVITEDKDGNPATVTAGTAQVYGPSVTFASGGVGYPAVCNKSSPMVMSANVEVFSGFKEQLRNVYARITTVSGGQTFCSKDPVGSFGGSLTPNVGLYRYQPLDLGTSAANAIRRTVQWAMYLPDNGTFWFKGELWAEVIPQPPTNILPADLATIHTGGTSAVTVSFTWTDDPLADGTNPEGYAVARPAHGALLTLIRCGRVSAGPYNPATCTASPVTSTRTTGSYSRRLTSDYWYQWSLQTSFLLPGNATRTLGSSVITRHFQVVRP
jgi:hypothetical protein